MFKEGGFKTTVTRFGEILPLGPNFKILWAFLMVPFNIWPNFEPNLVFLFYWANCNCCEWPNIENNLAIWSHCSKCPISRLTFDTKSFRSWDEKQLVNNLLPNGWLNRTMQRQVYLWSSVVWAQSVLRGRFQLQRSTVRIQAMDISINCRWVEKTKVKKKRPRISHFFINVRLTFII